MPRKRAQSPSVAAAAHAARRSALTDQLASFALRNGLGASVRRLAAHHRTSDRMLLYYFGTKEKLLVAVLERISERLDAILQRFSSPSATSPGRFLAEALRLLANPQTAPFMRLWSEVIARGARGEHPYRNVAARIISDWLRWIEARIRLPGDKSRREQAASILAAVEGATLLEMTSPGSTKGVAAFLSAALDGSARGLRAAAVRAAPVRGRGGKVQPGEPIVR